MIWNKCEKMAGVRPVWTSDEGTMAQETAKSRWPKIVSGMVDDVQLEMEVPEIAVARREEGQRIVQRLSELRKDIQNDEPLR